MDKYERVKKIGEGSFGKALLVRRRNDGRHCVVKEIAIGKMNSKEREESKKEVKVLSQLKHPNIVMYQESFEGMGNLYIVMDYCEGGDLYQKIVSQRGVNFNEGQVLDYFVQICLALKHIHDRKILHRDLKSQNIFLTRHGIVKLGDFGIARVLKSTVELARTCIGTPYYLSPEICENRPYNNKSDIWSLGCVLYELCTLKHAFEAGNMKNLVLKIIRGNYPPLPNRYTPALRSLVAHCFKRSPMERPSVNRVLKNPIIQERIKKYLSPEVLEDEFSHTVLHKEKFGAIPKQPISRPVSAASDAKKANPVAQVYGVSVAKRPVSAVNNKRPMPGVAQPKRPPSAGKRPSSSNEQNKSSERRKEMEARERRRRNLVDNQEREYQEYLKNIQKKRYEKQQVERMNRAREAGWKGLLKADEEKNKKAHNIVMSRQQNPMEKYTPKERPKEKSEDQKENKNEENIPEQRPISARERPFDAYVAAKKAQENRASAAEAAERARLVEEYKQRKREAAENKSRGSYDYKPSPALQQQNRPEFEAREVDAMAPRAAVLAAPAVQGRNREEQSYLEQLERIRRQNYNERKALQNRNAVKPPLPASNKPEARPGAAAFDPRYDPEARRQKIAALKAQADQRAVALKDELNKRRRALQQRLEDERNDREQQQWRHQKPIHKVDDRPLPAQRKPTQEKPKIVAAAVGLETAMNQVAAARLFRSCSEGDLQDLVKKGEQMIHDRKHWNEAGDLGLAALPLEVTASAMEVTSFSDAVFKPANQNARPESAPHRRAWAPEGKTQLLSALENKTIAANTIFPSREAANPAIGATVVLPKQAGSPISKAIGETIILPKKQSPAIGKTVVISSQKQEGKDAQMGETIVLPKKESGEQSDLKYKGESPIREESPRKGGEVTSEAEEGNDAKGDAGNKSKEASIAQRADDKKIVDEDDEDIEELTVVSEGKIKEKEKPKARAAWGENGKSPLVFKHEDDHDSKLSEKEGASDLEAKKEKEIESENERENEPENEPNLNKAEMKSEPLFVKTGAKESCESSNDVEIQDVSIENEDSFHTPNASLLETRSKGLKTGLYDSPAKILRTVSMPEIPRNARAASNDDTDENEAEDELELEEENDVASNEVSNENNDDDDEKNDEIFCEDDDDEGRSDEEIEDFEHMLDSMRGVLSSADASPPTSAKVTLPKKPPVDDEDDEDDTRCSSSASRKSNEEWDSDDGDDDDDDGNLASETMKDPVKEATRTAKRTKARETLFQRIEQSRKSLEDELGTDRFLKVYRYIQAMQENEDDDMNIDPNKDEELSDMLEGKNEHLYQRILYLVLADAAYFEDNE